MSQAIHVITATRASLEAQVAQSAEAVGGALAGVPVEELRKFALNLIAGLAAAHGKHLAETPDGGANGLAKGKLVIAEDGAQAWCPHLAPGDYAIVALNPSSAKPELDKFETWADSHLGQGYPLTREEGTYVNKVTRWAFNSWRAGRQRLREELAAQAVSAPKVRADTADAIVEFLDTVGKVHRYDVTEHIKLVRALALGAEEPGHPDDAAVDRFAGALKGRLKADRNSDSPAWANSAQSTTDELANELVQLVHAGDPVEVGCLAMKLHQHNAVSGELMVALTAFVSDELRSASPRRLRLAPQPFGYFHELLDHEGKGNGIWLGCADKKVTEQSYIEGETSPEVFALYAEATAAVKPSDLSARVAAPIMQVQLG